MNPGYTLSAGNRINAAAPELHTHSMEVVQESLQPGDFIEIGIERKPIEDGDSPILVESVFARVEAVNWPFIDAVIHSQAHFSKLHGLCSGDTVSCSDKQILCFLPTNDPKTEGWINFVTKKLVEMRREFLVTLDLNELPSDCFTKCVLDTDTTVLIGPMGGKRLGIFVGVNVWEPSESGPSSNDPTRSQILFHEAAVRLGFTSGLPGQIVSSERNQLVLSMDPSASGQRLIDLVFTSIEQVRQETTRVLVEQAAKGGTAVSG